MYIHVHCTCIYMYMYMQLLEGRDVCPSAEPYEARVDVLVSTQPETEAKWLRNVTMEIDYVRYMYM